MYRIYLKFCVLSKELECLVKPEYSFYQIIEELMNVYKEIEEILEMDNFLILEEESLTIVDNHVSLYSMNISDGMRFLVF